jgi:superfamily II DNA/RNA helicase
VPSVELHGNLAQNARDRNLRAFTDGTARTLVATDIAARGIHVDNVTLVVHADPPMEHKAYLHRSGRTARAGADGTVITLMTDDQVADVGLLTRRAGIKPTTTRLRPGDPLLRRLAPGERTYQVIAINESTVDSPPRAVRRQGRPSRSRRATVTASSATTGAARTSIGRPAQGQAADIGATRGRTNKSHRTSATTTPATVAARTAAAPTTSGGAAAFSSGTRIGRRGR